MTMDSYRISTPTLQAVIRTLEELPARVSRHLLAILETEVNAQNAEAEAQAQASAEAKADAS